MSQTRFSALETVATRGENFPFFTETEAQPTIAEIFGENVFGDAQMKAHLPEKAYLAVKSAVQTGAQLDRSVADDVAEGMKKWAQDKGCTHFAHWFQPLTGKTAEKHDSFFTLTHDGRVVEEFTGSALAQQEPDGSSFPSGGLRSTFEARGYTVWDPSSPAFLMEVGEGKTLCIPTIFVTYSGEAQDFKLPLLRSQAVLDKAGTAVAQYFDKEATKVSATQGLHARRRPRGAPTRPPVRRPRRTDRTPCLRTPCGASAPRHQRLLLRRTRPMVRRTPRSKARGIANLAVGTRDGALPSRADMRFTVVGDPERTGGPKVLC